jgi:hypothetical protein
LLHGYPGGGDSEAADKRPHRAAEDVIPRQLKRHVGALLGNDLTKRFEVYSFRFEQSSDYLTLCLIEWYCTHCLILSLSNADDLSARSSFWRDHVGQGSVCRPLASNEKVLQLQRKKIL